MQIKKYKYIPGCFLTKCRKQLVDNWKAEKKGWKKVLVKVTDKLQGAILKVHYEVVTEKSQTIQLFA